MKAFITILVGSLCVTLMAPVAHAGGGRVSCSYEVQPLKVTFDKWWGPENTGWCNNLSWLNKAYGITKSNWSSSGWSNPCDNTLALGRTYAAAWLLASEENNSTGNMNVLGKYARQQIDELRPECGDVFGRWLGGGEVSIQQAFFATDVIERAATLVHEARHSAKVHNAGNPKTRDSSLSYDGAWAFEWKWEADFAGNSVWGSNAQRCRAMGLANDTAAPMMNFKSAIRVRGLTC